MSPRGRGPRYARRAHGADGSFNAQRRAAIYARTIRARRRSRRDAREGDDLLDAELGDGHRRIHGHSSCWLAIPRSGCPLMAGRSRPSRASHRCALLFIGVRKDPRTPAGSHRSGADDNRRDAPRVGRARWILPRSQKSHGHDLDRLGSSRGIGGRLARGSAGLASTRRSDGRHCQCKTSAASGLRIGRRLVGGRCRGRSPGGRCRRCGSGPGTRPDGPATARRRARGVARRPRVVGWRGPLG
jgi:hypothetical protein